MSRPTSPLPPAGGDYAFLNAPPPPSKRHSRLQHDAARQRAALTPRAAVVNHFQLDLSFLEDEPPPRPSKSGHALVAAAGHQRRTSAITMRSVASMRGEQQSDYSDMLAAAAAGGPDTARSRSPQPPSSRPASVVAPQGLTFPSASRPFPGRPRRFERALSTFSVSTTASFDSDEMVATSQHMPPTPEAEDAPILRAVEDSEDVERRKRLALALDQTASAMEGGKSLAMAKEELIRSPQIEQQPFPSVDFVAAVELPDAKEAEQRAKRAEKRRRTILELCDTEALYASDMAVARDIYLERAKGVDITQIADRVMAAGLGLKDAADVPSPDPDASEPRAVSPPVAVRPAFLRTVTHPGDPRRPSGAPSFQAKLEKRRATMASMHKAAPRPVATLLPPKDIHLIFANLEAIAGLAEAFAGVLDGAKGSDTEGVMDDRIGEVFSEMIPRIQDVYSTYCSKHHRAITRLQELENGLKAYHADCKTVAHGRTSAWDLASLLIKPVQRCLKYPLLLDQILAVTPEDHPDRANLQRANTQALAMAEHINEFKKRSEAVSRIVSKKDSNPRRESSRSISSTVGKKLLRGSQKAKNALGLTESDTNERDEMFDTLSALVDSTRAACVRFEGEMKDWSKSTKVALEAQVALVENWIDVYAPMEGESAPNSSHHRLCVFLDEVLIPLMEGPWRELDHEIRRSLIVKTEHLLSLFDSPLRVIAKRNDKRLDHQRFTKTKNPADRRGSEEYLGLTTSLMDELPRFLGSVSRYFNIVVEHFGGAQAAYHEAVQERWDAYGDAWLHQIPSGNFKQIEASFLEGHKTVDEMMSTLAKGLGVASASAAAAVGPTTKQNGRMSGPSPFPTKTFPTTSSQQPTPTSVKRTTPNFANYSFGDVATAVPTGNRISVDSASTDPSSFSSSRGQSMVSDASTAPSSAAASRRRPSYAHHRTTDSFDDRLMLAKAIARKTSEDAESSERVAEFWRRRSSTASKVISGYAAPAQPELKEEEDGSDEEPPVVMYRAEAMKGSKSSAFRSGYPVFSFKIGELFDVVLEEADSDEGGAGWLLGRKVMHPEMDLGWGRTEGFAIAESSSAEDG